MKLLTRTMVFILTCCLSISMAFANTPSPFEDSLFSADGEEQNSDLDQGDEAVLSYVMKSKENKMNAEEAHQKVSKLFDHKIEKAEKDNLTLDEEVVNMQNLFNRKIKKMEKIKARLLQAPNLRALTMKLKKDQGNVNESMVMNGINQADTKALGQHAEKQINLLKASGSKAQYLKLQKAKILKSLTQSQSAISSFDWDDLVLPLILLVPAILIVMAFIYMTIGWAVIATIGIILALFDATVWVLCSAFCEVKHEKHVPKKFNQPISVPVYGALIG